MSELTRYIAVSLFEYDTKWLAADRNAKSVVLYADASALIASLKDDGAKEEARADMNAELLRRTAKALGLPTEGPGSSWADMPEKVSSLRLQLAQARGALKGIYDIICRRLSNPGDDSDTGEVVRAATICEKTLASLGGKE